MTRNDPAKPLSRLCRVSTYGWMLDSQLEELRDAGCSSRSIFREKVVGTRPGKHLVPSRCA
jgi:hypothetical protein